MKKNVLPNKASDLLLLAVNDAIALQKRSKKFKLNMNTWNSIIDEKCNVCMAGAVMIKELGCAPGNDNPLYRSGFELKHKLYAINGMRVGNLFDAFRDLSKFISTKQKLVIQDLQVLLLNEFLGSDLSRASWKTYRKVAKKLKSIGL